MYPKSFTPLCFYVLLHLILYCPLRMSRGMDQSSDYGIGQWVLAEMFQAHEHLGLFLPFTLQMSSHPVSRGRWRPGGAKPSCRSANPKEHEQSQLRSSETLGEFTWCHILLWSVILFMTDRTISSIIANNVDNNTTHIHIIQIIRKDS